MKLKTPPRGGHADNILPMINIVFLLLIFFMLAGALQSADIFEIEPVTSLAGQDDVLGPQTILISADGRFGIGDHQLSRDEVLQTVKTWQADTPDVTVRVKADGGTSAAGFVRLMEGLRALGIKELQLLTLSEVD